MLLFCPHCSNILRIEQGTNTLLSDSDNATTSNRWICTTCPYTCPIKKTWGERQTNKRKEVEDVIGGPAAWANAQKTEVQCPFREEGCEGSEAMFYQLQIRSADEPMTTFYKCGTCLREWREG